MGRKLTIYESFVTDMMVDVMPLINSSVSPREAARIFTIKWGKKLDELVRSKEKEMENAGAKSFFAVVKIWMGDRIRSTDANIDSGAIFAMVELETYLKKILKSLYDA